MPSTQEADAALRRLVRREPTGRGLPGDVAAPGQGERHRDAECRGSDPLRPDPQGQDPVKRRLGIADRSRRPHCP